MSTPDESNPLLWDVTAADLGPVAVLGAAGATSSAGTAWTGLRPLPLPLPPEGLEAGLGAAAGLWTACCLTP